MTGASTTRAISIPMTYVLPELACGLDAHVVRISRATLAFHHGEYHSACMVNSTILHKRPVTGSKYASISRNTTKACCSQQFFINNCNLRANSNPEFGIGLELSTSRRQQGCSNNVIPDPFSPPFDCWRPMQSVPCWCRRQSNRTGISTSLMPR